MNVWHRAPRQYEKILGSDTAETQLCCTEAQLTNQQLLKAQQRFRVLTALACSELVGPGNCTEVIQYRLSSFH
jgi:hypothetical protein